LIFVDPVPAALDTIEQMAHVYDIKVAIHNHGPEDKRWPRSTGRVCGCEVA
jgi:hypothetical protein